MPALSTIPSAAGYPNYTGSLISPIMSDMFVGRFYCESVFGQITTPAPFNALANYGNHIIFRREPLVTLHDYAKNQILESETISTDYLTLTIDRAKYFNVKIDEVDKHQIGDWDGYVDSIMKNATATAKKRIDGELLCSMYADVACKNRGRNAGCASGSYDLGAPGAPVIVTKDTFDDYFISLTCTLNEACIPMEDRWIVIPSAMVRIALQTPWMNCCFDNNNQTAHANGMLPGKIHGFTVYVSDSVSRVYDPTVGTWCYNIVAGWKSALAFTIQLEKTRVAQSDRAFATFYQGLMVYGFGTMYPEGLAHSYVRLA
jgi:hypothetical protein